MKIRRFHILPVFLIASVAISSVTFSLELQAQTDTTFDSDKAACAQNSSREWSTRLNRCVEKVESKATRHEAINCNNLESLEERKNCEMDLASRKSGVTSNAEEAASKISDLQSKSSLINTAYAVISLINLIGKASTKSTCTSKKVFGITSMAGSLTDIFLKIKTKNKVKSFQDRYQIDLKDNAYNAQTKALQYLKEEQEMVKDIASLEKKRQMLLLLGYGAATVIAGMETFSNTSCWKPEPEPTKVAEPTPETGTQPPAQAEVAPPADNPPTAASVDAGKGGEPPPVGDNQAAGGGQQTYTATTDTAAAAAPPPAAPAEAAKPTQHLESRSSGNYKYNTIVETTADGKSKVIGVVHNGEVYESFSEKKNGVFVATGTPTGKYNYTTGEWKNGQTSASGLRINYGPTREANISELGFGTDKTAPKVTPPPKVKAKPKAGRH